MNHTQSSSGSKTRQQIALEFDFSYLTLWRRLNDYEIDPPKGLIGPKWQKIIYEKLGYPPGVFRKDFELESEREQVLECEIL